MATVSIVVKSEGGKSAAQDIRSVERAAEEMNEAFLELNTS